MSMVKPNGQVDNGEFSSLREIWPHIEHQRSNGEMPKTPKFWLITGTYTQGIAGTRDA